MSDIEVRLEKVHQDNRKSVILGLITGLVIFVPIGAAVLYYYFL